MTPAAELGAAVLAAYTAQVRRLGDPAGEADDDRVTAGEIAAVLDAHQFTRGGPPQPRDQLIAAATSLVLTRLRELAGPRPGGPVGEAQLAVLTALVTATITDLADQGLLATHTTADPDDDAQDDPVPVRADQVVVLADPAPAPRWAGLIPAARAAAGVAPDEPFAVLVVLDHGHRPLPGMWEAFLREGLFAFAVWGDRGEQVHDDVDSAALMLELDDPAAAVGTTVTGWLTHTVAEALGDFVSLTRPAGDRRDGRLRLILLDDHVDPAPVTAWFDRHHLPVTRIPT